MPDSRPRPIVFLGGIFTPLQTDFIIAKSKGVVQNAADALQKNLIRGLSASRVSMVMVNLPFIGSYPRGFSQKIFPATEEFVFDRVKVHGQSFVAIRFIKSFSRMWGAFKGLYQVEKSRRAVIVIYSAHLPFLIAALLHRAWFRNIRVCLILPDFPEFMGEGGRLYNIAKAIESRVFYFLARRIDCFVVLTRYMARRLALNECQYTVVEGIAEEAPSTTQVASVPNQGGRAFLYTGTLASRYGIMDLVHAFLMVKNPRAELWICGEGDSRDRITNAMKRDPRIKFWGQVSREEARRLQTEANILVNPRSSRGEFTKYSFPSKTMEYMASGRPVLMHRLPGMPDEYLPYFVSPASTDISSLAASLEEMAGWDDERLEELGSCARKFILTEKNAEVQCRKIVDLILSLR